jgi:hypothetical protein
MRFIEFPTRVAFAIASIALMILACALIFYAGVQVVEAFNAPDMSVGSTLLDAVGYTVIAIAVFDVGKYLFEEEAIRAREMRQAGEARRSLTKFVSTITIAVLLEGLVTVFEAGAEDVRLMLYPTLLLLAGVAMIVGLGVYQKLSAEVERTVRDPGKHEEAPPTLAAQAEAEASDASAR